MFRASSELASVMEFGFQQATAQCYDVESVKILNVAIRSKHALSNSILSLTLPVFVPSMRILLGS